MMVEYGVKKEINGWQLVITKNDTVWCICSKMEKIIQNKSIDS